MNCNTSAISAASTQFSAAAGTGAAHRVDAGAAVTLQPRQSCEIVMDSGTAWLTFGGQPGRRPLARMGDLRLGPGTRLTLAAGDEVVLEPIAPAAGARVEPVRFTLAPLAAPLLNWQASVVEPARELAQALAATGRALQRLATGLALWLRRPGLGSA